LWSIIGALAKLPKRFAVCVHFDTKKVKLEKDQIILKEQNNNLNGQLIYKRLSFESERVL
jgi:hypothetical protein